MIAYEIHDHRGLVTIQMAETAAAALAHWPGCTAVVSPVQPGQTWRYKDGSRPMIRISRWLHDRWEVVVENAITGQLLHGFVTILCDLESGPQPSRLAS